MSDWKIAIMKLKYDSPTQELIEVFQNIWSDGIILKQKRRSHIKRGEVTASVKRAFKDLEGKILTLYGKGSYHYYTYGLCKVVADPRSKKYCYMHLDRHDDAIFNKHYHLRLSDFVQHIKKYTNANFALLLGPPRFCDNTLFNLEPGIELITEKELYKQKEFRERIIKQPEEDVYLSCDLDVLHPKEFNAWYTRGRLRLKDAKRIVKTINEEKNIISADILGYAGSDLKSCLIYAVLAGTLIGKDTKEAEKLFQYLKKNPNTPYEDSLKLIEGLKI